MECVGSRFFSVVTEYTETLNQEPNKTFFALQEEEEEEKHERHERKNLIIGVIIFILMLPLDYVIIEKVSKYKEKKQKESAALNLNINRTPQNGIRIPTTIEPPVTPQTRPVQTIQTNITPDGWLEVNGKRYVIDGRTITKTK